MFSFGCVVTELDTSNVGPHYTELRLAHIRLVPYSRHPLTVLSPYSHLTLHHTYKHTHIRTYICTHTHTYADFDFHVEGVTSMSLDTHKYGYALKGTSVLLYANKHLRQAQYFCYADWTGGLYTTPTLAGNWKNSLIKSVSHLFYCIHQF